MRLRKLLLTTGAIVAAGAISMAPTAVATTPGAPISLVVVGSPANMSHPIYLTMKSASVSIKVYGITTNITCTAGAASGIVKGGTSGIPTYEMSLNSLTLTCPSIFPGTTVTMTQTCPIDIDFNDLVHPLLVDTGANPANKFHRVAGTAYITNHATPPVDCVQVNISNGCQFQVGGTAGAWFDEAIKTIGSLPYQDLTLSSTTVTVKNPTGCLGAVTNGQTFTLNAVFNVQSPNGLIDFQ